MRDSYAESAIVKMEANAGERLDKLRDDLRRDRYRPGGVRRRNVAKAGHALRSVTMLSLDDRVVQTATHQVLAPLVDIEFSSDTFGFRPNRSLGDALLRVHQYQQVGLQWVVDADIKDCFGQIRHDRLRKRLKSSFSDRKLLNLIDCWLVAFGNDGLGLPQGAPLSPLLANIALDVIDKRFDGPSRRIVRFADDFLILCPSRRGARQALRQCESLLAKEGLILNGDKTKITSFDEGFAFLGHYFIRDLVLRDASAAACEELRRRAKGPAKKRCTWPGRLYGTRS